MSDEVFLKCACPYCQGHLEFPAHALGITTTCPHCGVETKLVDESNPASPPVPARTLTSKPPTPPPPPAPPAPPPATVIEPVASGAAELQPGATATGGAKVKRVLKVVWSMLAGLAVVLFVGFKIWVKFRTIKSAVDIVKSEPKANKPKPTAGTSNPAPMPAPAAPATSIVVAKGNAPVRKAGEDLQVLNFEVQRAKDGNLQYVIGIVTNHSAKQFFNVKLEFELTRPTGKPGDLATDSIRNLPANAALPFKASIIGTAPVISARLAKLEGEKE